MSTVCFFRLYAKRLKKLKGCSFIHMSGRYDDSMRYVMDQARQLDPDRHFMAMLAPAIHRRHLMTLIAFSAEIGAVRASVSEPMIGQMKFAWWRDLLTALEEGKSAPKGHPLSQALERLLLETALHPHDLVTLVDAREAELLDQDLTSAKALQQHVRASCVPLMHGICTLLSGEPGPSAADQLSEFHGFVRALAALSAEAEQSAVPARLTSELEAGREAAEQLATELKGALKGWPKSLRPMLPLYSLSFRRLSLLQQSQNGLEALALRPNVFSSLLTMWTGRI